MPMSKSEFEEKYRKLVWYARSDGHASPNPRVRDAFAEVQAMYPSEAAALKSDQDGENIQWTHGFNSGMLAALRLIRGGRVTHASQASFPNLDT